MKIKYEGMKATKKHLVIYGVLESGSVIRFVHIDIPIGTIDAGVLAETADQKVRLDLLAIWSSERGEDLPLF